MSGNKNYGMFQSDPGDEAADINQVEASETAADFKPFSDAYLQNPYLFFDRARESEPVFYSPEYNYWVVLKYEDIATVYRDPDTYSPVNAVTR